MVKIDRILFPTDSSECADRARPEARRLALEHGADLHVLRVNEASAGVPGCREAEQAAGSGDGIIRHEVDNADVATAILDRARDLDVDLIVMGSHGRRGVRRLVLGSVAEDVLRGCVAPVLLCRCRTGSTEGPGYRRVLVPLDFTLATPVALRHSSALTTRDSVIDLIHVIAQPGYPDFQVGAMALPRDRRAARSRLAELAAGLGPVRGVGVDVLAGDVAGEIAEYARSGGHDLVIMASHMPSGLKRLARGSTTLKVARRAPCPLLAFDAGGRGLLDSPTARAGATALD